jgi:molybdopterin-synthase adenylyltransferase
MNYVLRMRSEHHRRLAALLQVAMPAESVTFLLCRRAVARNKVIFLVDEIIRVDQSDYAAQAEDIASITPLAMARIAKHAREKNRNIVMAHLHPMTGNGVSFSEADHRGNKRSFAFFHQRARQPEHLALVWNSDISECQGLVYKSDDTTAPLDSMVTVDGEFWKEYVPRSGVGLACFDRQAMLLGTAGQKRLGVIKCGVIGLGGTGSLASLALVHHGFRNLTLVDDELVDATNLPRIPASVPTDIKTRRKVDIARDYALEHAPDTKVDALSLNVEHDEVRPYLIACDLIVICTDNTTSRAYLNQLSQQYLIPILDIGVQFSINESQEVSNEIGRINLVRPGTPCLWCSAHISPSRLAAESVPAHERAKAGSYLRGMDDPQPSMLAFNMEIVGRSIQILLGYLTGLFSQPIAAYEQRSFLRSKGGSLVRQVSKTHRPGCPTCGAVGCGPEIEMLIRKRAA